MLIEMVGDELYFQAVTDRAQTIDSGVVKKGTDNKRDRNRGADSRGAKASRGTEAGGDRPRSQAGGASCAKSQCPTPNSQIAVWEFLGVGSWKLSLTRRTRSSSASV